MNKFLSIPVEEFSLEKFGGDNRIAKLSLKFMHSGENLNRSFISLSSIENAISDSLNNSPTGIPILASFEDDGSDFKEHNDDEISIGCIPPNNNNINYKEENGKTYVYADGFIWRYYSKNAIDILEQANEMTKGCSIEIEILEGHKDKKKGIYIIDKFQFLGVTLLGDIYPAGMKGANAKLEYSLESKERYISKLKDFTNELNLYFKQIEIDNYQKISTENFSENINNTLIQSKKEDDGMNKIKIAENFKLTVMQLYEELHKAVCQKKYIEEWYDESYECCVYWLRDFDGEYVFAYNCQSGIEVKMPYMMDGDNPVIDFEKVTRIKYIAEDWDNGVTDPEEGMEVESEFSRTVKSVKEDFAKAIKSNVEKAFNSEKEIYVKEFDTKLSTKEEELAIVKTQCENFSNDLAKVTEDLNTINSELTTAKTDYIEVTKNFSVLQESVKTKDIEIDLLKVENEKLNTFKLNSAKEERRSKAQAIFNDNLGLLSSEEIEKFTKDAEDIEDFTVFETKLQSFLFVRSKEVNKGITSDVNFSYVPNANKPSDSQNKDENRWAVYSKEYNNN